MDDSSLGAHEIKDKVRVAVRIRPLSENELEQGGHNIVESSGPELRLKQLAKPPLNYVFNLVFPAEASQQRVFDELGRQMVAHTISGYNCTIFAYGQTGSGKTYTMLNQAAGDARGLVPRLSVELFRCIRESQVASAQRTFLACCSFFEIYNEFIYDLFVPRKSRVSAGLEIRELQAVGVYIKDLTEIVVDSSEKLDDLIAKGFQSRATAATKMNQSSSRSHCILTVKLFQKHVEDDSQNTFATMNVVDLAGSERIKDTGETDGVILKEGANINKSLSALGNVISALSAQATNNKKIFVPFRNSKLTRVLQTSLGGNGFCTMLANISPASMNFDETLNTLNYAKRAKVIRVRAVKNEETAHVAKLNDEVDNLRERLQQQTAQAADATATELREIEEKYDKRIEELQGFIGQTWQDKQKLSEQHERERVRLLEEARRRDEHLLQARRRKLELLEEKGDLMQTIREVDTLDSEVCSTWTERLSQATSLEQRIQSQIDAVLLFRNTLRQDLWVWWGARNTKAEMQHLQHASVKLSSMVSEVDILAGLEGEISGVLTTVAPEMEKAVSSCNETKDEVAEILKLAVRQLGAYRLQIHRSLSEVRPKVALEEEIPRLQEALGAGAVPDSPDSAVQQCASKAALEMMMEELGADMDFGTLEPLENVTETFPSALGLSGSDWEFPMSASSNAIAASCGRLLREEGPYGGWCAAVDVVGQYLEIDIGAERYVSVISTQGRVPVTGRWEQTQALLLQALGDTLLPGGDPLPSADRVYMRPPVRFVHDVAVAFDQKFGIFDKVLTQEQLDYQQLKSSEARLNFFNDLIERVRAIDGVEYLEVSPHDIVSGRNTLETGRLLQILAYSALKKTANDHGGLLDLRPQWTTKYTLELKQDDEWQPVCTDDGVTQVFEGNWDGTSVKSSSFTPFKARHVRIHPLEWHGHPALRVELYGSESVPASACRGLLKRLREAIVMVETLRERAEDEQGEDDAEQEAQAAQQEWEQAEIERRFEKLKFDLTELRGLKDAAEERAMEQETAMLQMKVERDRAEALVKQLRDEVQRQVEAHSADKQLITGLRHQNESLQERVAEMAERIEILEEERDFSYMREEMLFEEKVAVEELKDTTEGYLTDRLVEKDKILVEKDEEIGSLSQQLRLSPTSATSTARDQGPCAIVRRSCLQGGAESDVYEESFSGESGVDSPRGC